MPPATSNRDNHSPSRGPALSQPLSMQRLREEKGIWAIPAAATLALAMLGALAASLDVAMIGYGRLQLWSAVATTARAAARCLGSPSQSTSRSSGVEAAAESACLDGTVPQVFSADIRAGSAVSGAVSSHVTSQPGSSPTGSQVPTVLVDGQATVSLPFPLPGLSSVTVWDSATASLIPVPSASSP